MNRLVAVSIFLVSFMLSAEDAHRDQLTNHLTATGRLTLSSTATVTRYGIRFECSGEQIRQIEKEMGDFFLEINFPINQVRIQKAIDGTSIQYGLKTADDDTNTLDLIERADLKIPRCENHELMIDSVKTTVTIPSKNEILAGLLQHGRLVVLSGKKCSVRKLKNHLEMRQRIALWARTPRRWRFATGDGTRLNTVTMWNDGWIVKSNVSCNAAVANAFGGQSHQYSIACNRECRLIMLQGIFDYVNNSAKDALLSEHLERISGSEPMSEMRPEDDDNMIVKEGKYLDRALGVPANNWIPGDWGWIKNTDPKSYEYAGLEGSNTIYTGGNTFANLASGGIGPTFNKKIMGVYHWRSSTLQKSQTPELIKTLSEDPRKGGLLLDFRDFPKIF